MSSTLLGKEHAPPPHNWRRRPTRTSPLRPWSPWASARSRPAGWVAQNRSQLKAGAHHDHRDGVVRGHPALPQLASSPAMLPPRWLPRTRRGLGSGRVPILHLVAVAFALRCHLRSSLLVPLAGASIGSAVHPSVPEAVLGVARPLYRTLPQADEPLGQSASLLSAP
jgi:hypothetical protein